jgi:hypothetical protein
MFLDVDSTMEVLVKIVDLTLVNPCLGHPRMVLLVCLVLSKHCKSEGLLGARKNTYHSSLMNGFNVVTNTFTRVDKWNRFPRNMVMQF